MKESQFKIVKTMLEFPKITPALLVKSWNKFGTNITLEQVNKVAVSRDYAHFQEMPDEDIDTLGAQLFGDMWKSMRKAS